MNASMSSIIAEPLVPLPDSALVKIIDVCTRVSTRSNPR